MPKKPVGRPKFVIPVDVDFRVRTTQSERAAIDTMIERWRQEREAAGGIPSPGDGPTLWFRSLVRKLAHDQGIPVDDAPPDPVPARASGKPSPKARK